MQKRKIYTPDETSKHEMAGRMYEAIDIQLAIEQGHLKTVDDILNRLKDQSQLISQVLRADTWVSTEDRVHLDLVETIKYNENALAGA